MSYLDFPRLHFSGLFFTNPSTINNITDNYTPDVPLTNPPPPPDQYDPNVALWNPTGVAQWWLEECTVLSAVGTGGAEVDASDAVIGALVQGPSQKTPISDGEGGFYDIAKMVDLDPDQQGRSALYGLRIAVTLPNGAGFQGLMTVPEIRQLNTRIAIAQSSWGFVCNWMGTLQDVQWSGDISGSPLLTALQAASGTQGLAVKLTPDLHQNNPGNVFTAGDSRGTGRSRADRQASAARPRPRGGADEGARHVERCALRRRCRHRAARSVESDFRHHPAGRLAKFLQHRHRRFDSFECDARP